MYGNQRFSPEIYRQEANEVRQLYMEQILAGIAYQQEYKQFKAVARSV
jgi:hypothetical protein